MENHNQNTIDKLNHLISIAEDGKEGYENAAKDIKDNDFKSSFSVFAKERSMYASDLRHLVHQFNAESEDDGGGPVGTLHRVWMDLKSVLTSGDTDAIINACITGEEAAVKEYTLVLEDASVNESCKPTLREQLQGIEQALANIKSHVNV